MEVCASRSRSLLATEAKIAPHRSRAVEARPLEAQRCLQIVSNRKLQAGQLSARYVTNFFGRSCALKLISSAGLKNDAGNLPGSFSKATFWQLCLDNINITNDEGHGITKQPLPKSAWGVIFAAINQMETVGQGVRRFAELVQIVPAGITVTVGYGDTGVHLNFDASETPADVERMERYIEVIAMVFHCALLWITAAPIAPVHVRLSSLLDEEDGSMLSSLTKTYARRGSGVTIVYDCDDMLLPLGVRKYRYWSNETAAFFEFDAKPHSPPVQQASPTAERVRRLLAERDLAQPEAASAMAMSVATLQRHLREEGTSFRELSKEVRRDKLISLLATDGNLDDIAVELGFSERRSLWRSCHDWLGVSPTQYRMHQRAAARSSSAHL